MKKLIILSFAVVVFFNCSSEGSSSDDDDIGDGDIISDCTNLNSFNYNFTSTMETDCETIEFVGDLNLVGQPYYALGIDNGVIITGGENSSTSLKFDLHSRNIEIFPSSIFNTEFRVHPNSTQIKKLSIGANENRKDEIIKFDFNGVRVYSVNNNSENLETYNFDVTELIPISPNNGHEYRTVGRIYEAFKINGYLYLFFSHSYNNLNLNSVYYRYFLIRASEYGAGSWEYLGEYGSNIGGNALINEMIVTNSGKALFVTDNIILEFDLNTNSFNDINLDPPLEFSQNDGVSESFKGLLCGEINFDGNKEFVHYAYSSLNDSSNLFKIWYYNNSLNSWFETNQILDFGNGDARMRATSIKRTDDGANVLFNVNQDGEMYLFSPN